MSFFSFVCGHGNRNQVQNGFRRDGLGSVSYEQHNGGSVEAVGGNRTSHMLFGQIVSRCQVGFTDWDVYEQYKHLLEARWRMK